ncbi:MAG: insulinase family protein [Kofleriaceae bacterium]|nr:insulinase family protein [Kofleriaceae bacterium]
MAIQAWVSVGSSDELEKQAGLCHVMEHMLFKGTKVRGAGEIAADVESAGGEINAWTSQDSTVFHVVMPSRYADVGIDVLSDLLTNSNLDAESLSREREVIVEEIRQGRDEPLRRLAQNMFNGSFEGHPYAKAVIGSEESVRSFRASDLRRFKERWYRGNNISVIVAGGFDEAQMKARIEKEFSGIAQGTRIRRPSVKGGVTATRSASLETAPIGQSQVALAIRMPSLLDPACAAMDLLTIVLGQGESSILSKELVREKEVCRSAYSYLHALQDYSLAVIGAVADPAKLRKLLPLLGRNIQELRDRTIGSSELAKAQQAITADAIYQRETAEGAAHAVGSYLSLTGDPDSEEKYLAKIATITASELREVAHEYFRPDRLNLTALVPESPTLNTADKRNARAKLLLGLVDGGMAKARKSAPKRASASKRKAPKHAPIVEHSLKNGMKILIQRDPSVPIVAARAVWTGGQLWESSRNAGISELLAASITRGCGSMKAAEIIEVVDAQSATLSGFAGRNSFGVRAEWLATHWQQGFKLMADCLRSPSFEEEEVLRAKRRQEIRIASQGENPSARAFSLFHQTLFRKHQYRYNLSGNAKSVRSLNSAQVRKHYRKHYPISGLTLSIVGDVDPKEVIAQAESLFGAEPVRSSPERKPTREVFTNRTPGSRQVYEEMEREQSQLVVGFPGITIVDKDRWALEVLTTVLGGQGGRLFTQLRDKESLAYQLGAFSLEGLDPGYVAVYLSCSPAKMERAIEAVREQIDALRNRKITQRELVRSKRLLIGTHEIALQRRSSVAAALAFHHAYGLSSDEHFRYADYVQQVTLADVHRVATRILDWDQAIVVMVSPAHASPAAAERASGKVKKTRKRRRK